MRIILVQIVELLRRLASMPRGTPAAAALALACLPAGMAQAGPLSAEASGLKLDLLTVGRAADLADPRRAPYTYSFSASLMLSQGGALGMDALRDAAAARSRAGGEAKPGLLATDPAGRPWFDGSPSLGPHFRFESKGERFEFRPRRDSVWFQYSREFQ